MAGEGLHDVEDRRFRARRGRARRSSRGRRRSPRAVRPKGSSDRSARPGIWSSLSGDSSMVAVSSSCRANSPMIRCRSERITSSSSSGERPTSTATLVPEQRDEPFLAGPKGGGFVDRTSARSSPAISRRSPQEEGSCGDAGAGERSARCGECFRHWLVHNSLRKSEKGLWQKGLGPDRRLAKSGKVCLHPAFVCGLD